MPVSRPFGLRYLTRFQGSAPGTRPAPTLPPPGSRALLVSPLTKECASKPTLLWPLWLVLLAAAPTAVRGQFFDQPVVPGGWIRLDVSPSFGFYDSRFGSREEGGRIIEEVEPLGFDYNDPAAGSRMLPHLAPGEESLRELLADPSYAIALGRSSGRMSANVRRIPLELTIGVIDRLTLGATVPFVRREMDMEFHLVGDSSTANAGLSPAVASPSSVSSFLGQFASSISATRGQIDDLCATSGESSSQCQDGRAFLADAEALHGAMDRAYAGSYVFPLTGSSAGSFIGGRVQEVQATMASYGVTSFVLPAPLADSAMDDEAFQQFLLDPSYGVGGAPAALGGVPLQHWTSVWDLGDVEVFGAFRILDLQVMDSAGTAARFRYRGTVGALVRLGTGKVDDPDTFVDLGSGDGQTDVELQMFNDILLGRRLGARLDVKYGIQLKGERARRVAAPDQVLPGLVFRDSLEWTPGNYFDLRMSPRLMLTPQIALAAHYRFASRGADTYSYARAAGEDEAPLPPVEASLLDLETEVTVHEMGIGLLYSTVEPYAEGRASLPFEIQATFDRAMAGSGGMTPRLSRFTVTLRLFAHIWGS